MSEFNEMRKVSVPVFGSLRLVAVVEDGQVVTPNIVFLRTAPEFCSFLSRAG